MPSIRIYHGTLIAGDKVNLCNKCFKEVLSSLELPHLSRRVEKEKTKSDAVSSNNLEGVILGKFYLKEGEKGYYDNQHYNPSHSMADKLGYVHLSKEGLEIVNADVRGVTKEAVERLNMKDDKLKKSKATQSWDDIPKYCKEHFDEEYGELDHKGQQLRIAGFCSKCYAVGQVYYVDTAR